MVDVRLGLARMLLEGRLGSAGWPMLAFKLVYLTRGKEAKGNAAQLSAAYMRRAAPTSAEAGFSYSNCCFCSTVGIRLHVLLVLALHAAVRSLAADTPQYGTQCSMRGQQRGNAQNDMCKQYRSATQPADSPLCTCCRPTFYGRCWL